MSCCEPIDADTVSCRYIIALKYQYQFTFVDVVLILIRLFLNLPCTGSLVYLLSAYYKVRVSVFDISDYESTLPALFIPFRFIRSLTQ